MTAAPAAAGQPGRDDLTARIFRALYQEFDLRTINGIYVVVPKGTPWFAGHSLGDIARQISDTTTRARPLPRPGPGRSPLPRHQQDLPPCLADKLHLSAQSCPRAPLRAVTVRPSRGAQVSDMAGSLVAVIDACAMH